MYGIFIRCWVVGKWSRESFFINEAVLKMVYVKGGGWH